jgi:hypothetical protein
MEPAIMTTATTTRPATSTTVGERRELGRYTTSDGERRLIVGQRVDGVVRLSDVPAAARGRAYLVERELEQDGHAALQALVSDYLRQVAEHNEIPMATNALKRYFHALDLG